MSKQLQVNRYNSKFYAASINVNKTPINNQSNILLINIHYVFTNIYYTLIRIILYITCKVF